MLFQHQKPSAREQRLMMLKVSKNFGNLFGDAIDRYVRSPVENGDPQDLIASVPAGIAATTFRSLDALFAGIANQEIRVPDGSMGESGRDLHLAREHLLPPQPLKLATDVIRLPGSVGTGFIDMAAGTETRYRTGRVLQAENN